MEMDGAPKSGAVVVSLSAARAQLIKVPAGLSAALHPSASPWCATTLRSANKSLETWQQNNAKVILIPSCHSVRRNEFSTWLRNIA